MSNSLRVSLLIFLPFLLTTSVYAQRIQKRMNKPIDSIDINFNNDTSVYVWQLKYNRPYVVKLHNVNKLVYKETTAQQKGTDLFSEVPSAFSSIKLPGFTSGFKTNNDKGFLYRDSSISVVENFTKECACVEPDKYLSNNARETFTAFTNSLQTVTSLGVQFNSLELLQTTLTELQTNVTSSWDSIKVRKMRAALNAITATVPDIDTFGKIEKYYKDVTDQIGKQTIVIDSLAKILINKLKPNMGNCIMADTIPWARKLRCLDPCKDSVAYYRLIKKLEPYQKCAAVYLQKIEDIKADVSKAVAFTKEVQTAQKEGKFTLVQKSYDVLSEENFTLTLETFVADKDVHEISFTAAAAEAQPFNQPQKKSFKITGITTGGVKFDFSTGAFFNVGNNSFLGPSYYYKKVTDSTKQIVEIDRTKKAMLSVGALAHAYIRMNSVIKPALSAGVSTTSGFETINFHGGLSLLFGAPGKNNRLVLSSGITLREVDLLDKRYQLGTIYGDLPDSVPTSKNFPKAGWFIAITYNFATTGK